MRTALLFINVPLFCFCLLQWVASSDGTHAFYFWQPSTSISIYIVCYSVVLIDCMRKINLLSLFSLFGIAWSYWGSSARVHLTIRTSHAAVFLTLKFFRQCSQWLCVSRSSAETKTLSDLGLRGSRSLVAARVAAEQNTASESDQYFNALNRE